MNFLILDSASATPLSITAPSATDIYTIAPDMAGNTVIKRNGTTVEDVATDSILSLSITGNPAYVSVDFSDGDPLPLAGLWSNAGQIALFGPHGSDPLVTTGTTAIIGSDIFQFPLSTEVSDHLSGSGGVVAVRGTAFVGLPFAGSTTQPATVFPGATVIANGNLTLSTLTVDAGGTFRMAESGASLITVGTLDIDGPDAVGDNGGVLDLSDNSMIAQDTSLSLIDELLANGFDSGEWDAAQNGGEVYDGADFAGPYPAAITSSAAEADSLQLHAVGYEQVGSGTGDWPASSTFDSRAVAAGDVVLKYTLYGDANLDGTVDSADDTITTNGYTNSLTGWGNGSFTYTGVTSAVDEVIAEYAVGFTGALFAEGTTDAPAFTPSGSLTGGYDVPGSDAEIDTGSVKGTVSVKTGASYTDSSGQPHDGNIALIFNRTDGVTAVGNSHWVRTITRTETDKNGDPISDEYPAKPVPDLKGDGKLIKITRQLGVMYDDAMTTLGWSSNIRPDSGTEIGVDQPDDSTRIGEQQGAASTTWIAHEYLVVNGAVIYEFSWTFVQFFAEGGIVSGYSDVTGQEASQIQGNPENLTIGIRQGGAPLTTANPAHI